MKMTIAWFRNLFTRKQNGHNGQAHGTHLIELNQVVKIYQSAAGGYQALKGIDLTIEEGEFVGIIGKSGSGKSTLINMITGIDRPSSGEVLVDGTPIHNLDENQMSRWRGKKLGIVFQFFQLLPTLTVIENIMLPMDFCGAFPVRERRKRAMSLLETVDMAAHAYKLPSALSGGQQQRVAIARALANDPAIIIADEPTGNLDSKTAEAMFALFTDLTSRGKTVVMVTHDSSLARRVSRTIIIADGEVVNEYIARALPMLTPQQMLAASHTAQPVVYPAGAAVIREGEPGQRFYVIARGAAEVTLKRPGGSDVVAARMEAGQYFGEIALHNQTRTVATVRAAGDAPVELLALDCDTFQSLLDESPEFSAAAEMTIKDRLAHNEAVRKGESQ
jgi:ABC-type lipoprotein export system ATPase subunit